MSRSDLISDAFTIIRNAIMAKKENADFPATKTLQSILGILKKENYIDNFKLIEDKMNLDYDTKFGHVRVVLLIESAINYYSLFLPVFYAESMKLTQELIESELHDSNKRLRMRARPKVLLAHDYEDAISIYQKYKDFIICIIII